MNERRVTHITTLHEVSGDKQVLLIRADLDVVRSNDWLRLVGVIQSLDVVQVGDVECCNMVAQSDGEVCEFAVIGNVRVDSQRVLGFGAQVEEQLSNALLPRRIAAEGVDDPDLAWANSGGNSSALGVARDELNILNAQALEAIRFLSFARELIEHLRQGS